MGTITPNIAPSIFAENSVLATLIFQPALMAQAIQVISAESFGGNDQKVIAASIWSAYKGKMTFVATWKRLLISLILN